jgi:hypothetical protein
VATNQEMGENQKKEEEISPETLWDSFQAVEKEADEDLQKLQHELRIPPPPQASSRRLLWAGIGLVSYVWFERLT